MRFFCPVCPVVEKVAAVESDKAASSRSCVCLRTFSSIPSAG